MRLLSGDRLASVCVGALLYNAAVSVLLFFVLPSTGLVHASSKPFSSRVLLGRDRPAQSMGCKNSRPCTRDQNQFHELRDKRSRSESRRNLSPVNGAVQAEGSTPRSRSTSARRDTSADSSAEPFRPIVPLTEVPLVLSRFEKLPAGTIKRYVYRVYDGDTITLRGEDNAKVRLLAMDTPEVQDSEPYAIEARDFVAKYLLNKKVYLTFEGAETDRYGRYLAYVFVKEVSVPSAPYLCINIATVEAGLANYYHPQGTPLSMDELFLKAQKSARQAHINIWHEVCEDFIVYLTAHGKAFHRKECRSIQHVALTSMTMGEALDVGHYACRDCHPNWASKLLLLQRDTQAVLDKKRHHVEKTPVATSENVERNVENVERASGEAADTATSAVTENLEAIGDDS